MNKYSDVTVKCDEKVQTLAIEYVPMQRNDFECVFSAEEGLIKGTIFPELYLPFCGERGAK